MGSNQLRFARNVQQSRKLPRNMRKKRKLFYRVKRDEWSVDPRIYEKCESIFYSVKSNFVALTQMITGQKANGKRSESGQHKAN